MVDCKVSLFGPRTSFGHFLIEEKEKSGKSIILETETPPKIVSTLIP